ncbi:hypothetical protein MAQ5080_02206 [Marinomonas aquimarina]|uniref:DUF2946 domain-containing protein n=1 Tax=Marinomonas aquimarina TaxID=295068 RepID=A0A1A8TFT0_9GAMM|nr:hypothetical protein [Marinomonas aquimarina]SBS32252.1 hypothetical protein MAQ5080_02206 [Marinomonas aquimarina]
MKRRSHVFLILCWLVYFAVPLVNGIGQTGAQRIEICTTLGVESYYVFSGDASDKDKASQHSSSHSCPCTHFFMDITTTALVFHAPSKAFDYSFAPTSDVLAVTPRTVQARAPPFDPALSKDQKLA